MGHMLVVLCIARGWHILCIYSITCLGLVIHMSINVCSGRYKMISLDRVKPSCLHTTLASLVDHPSSETVPQVSLKQTSTRPSLTPTVLPLLATSLTSPSLQRPRFQQKDWTPYSVLSLPTKCNTVFLEFAAEAELIANQSVNSMRR